MGGPRVWVAAAVGWCLLLAAALWIWPPAGDDAYAHSVMAVEQVKCWRQGVVWPRFHPDWNGGTGSFLPAVYAPLTLAAEGAACAVAGEGTRAAGLVLAGGLAAGALLLAAALRIRGRRGGLLWLAAAYPLAAVLARATTTEVMALALAGPVLVLGLPPGPSSWREGWAVAVAVAMMSGCQVGMVLMCGLLLGVAWLTVLPAAWAGGGRTAGWLAGGLAVGGVLWWPAVHDFRWMARQALVRGEYDWRLHHALAVTANEELGPFLVAVFLSLLAVFGVMILGRGEGRRDGPLLAALAAALILSTPLSFPLWHAVGPLAALQFPWRFLGPAAVLALAGVSRLRGRWKTAAVALIVAPAVLIPVELHGAVPGLRPSMSWVELGRRSGALYGMADVLPSMPGFYAPGFNGITSLDALHRQPGTVRRSGGGCRFPRRFVVETPSARRVLLPLQWWPELVVREGDRILPFENQKGLVSVFLPGGRHQLHVSLGPSRSRRVGAWLSAAGLAALLLLTAAARFRRTAVDGTGGGL